MTHPLIHRLPQVAALSLLLGCDPVGGIGDTGGTTGSTGADSTPNSASSGADAASYTSASTTGATSTETAASTGGETDSGGPGCEDDSVCSPLLQNCGEGEGCYEANGAFVCAPDASGVTGAAGDPCEFLNVCDPGLICVAAEDFPGCGGEGCCSAFCEVGDDSACVAGQTCAPTCLDGVGLCTADGGAPVSCEDDSECNPLANDCGEGEGCYEANGAFVCAPDASGVTGAAGDPCEFLNVCDPGLICVAAEDFPGCAGEGCCSAYCEVGDDSACVAGQTCAPTCLDGVGLCTAQ